MSWAWLALALSGWATLLGGVLILRRHKQLQLDQARQVYRLHFPADLAFDQVVAVLRSLVALGATHGPLAARPSVVFEIVATSDGLQHRLRVPATAKRALLNQLRAAVPHLVVEEIDTRLPWPGLGAGAEMRLTSFRRPLRTDQPEAAAASILATLSPLGADDALVLQWTVGATAQPSPSTAASHRGRSTDLGGLLRGFESERTSARDWREKTKEPLFGASLRVSASARTTDKARSLVRRVTSVLAAVEQPGVHFRARRLPARWVAARAIRATTPLVTFPMRLNARELGTVVGWPVGSPSVQGLPVARGQLLAPVAGVPSRGRVLGVSGVPGISRAIAVTASGSLHHAHVLGPTGVGKSTLLLNLAVQDAAAGRGMVVIDPKGDLVADLLDRIPPERESDVILLDPTDGSPVGLNLLEQAHEAPERVADLVVGMFHGLYAASWGPRTADILHASLLTLAQVPGQTLCELPLLLTNDTFRRRLVARVNDPIALGPFWAWYENISDGERAQAIGPVMNKLRPLLLRRRIRNTIGQAEPTWRIEDVLNRRRILLVSLAKGELGGEAAALVGSIVVGVLWQGIQRRAVRLPVTVMIDEFQDVLHLPTDLASVLAQARSFGVGLHLAHQHLGQLDSRMKAAVLANARTCVAFQSAAEDAATLARHLGGGLTPADMTALPAREAYAAVCVDGAKLPPARIRTSPPPPSLGSAERIRARSRARYGRSRESVEAAILARHQGQPRAQEELGRRRRRAS